MATTTNTGHAGTASSRVRSRRRPAHRLRRRRGRTSWAGVAAAILLVASALPTVPAAAADLLAGQDTGNGQVHAGSADLDETGPSGGADTDSTDTDSTDTGDTGGADTGDTEIDDTDGTDADGEPPAGPDDPALDPPDGQDAAFIPFANGGGTMSIVQVTAATQPAGSAFSYVVNFSCSATAASTCDDLVVTIPLDETTQPSMLTPGPRGWAYSATGPTVASAAVVGDSYVITMVPTIEAGQSVSFNLTVTPPNGPTHNGTTWELAPYAQGTNVELFEVDTPVTSTATASAVVDVAKTVTDGSSIVQQGQTVTYTLQYGCTPWPQLGFLHLASGTLVDTLPAGLTYLSSTPAGDYDPINHTVTWNFAGAAEMPQNCGGSAPSPGWGWSAITVEATVDADVADGTALANTATWTGQPLGGATPLSDSDSATVRAFLHPDPWSDGAGTTYNPTKLAQGRLDVAPAPATYAGNWIQPSAERPRLHHPEIEGGFQVRTAYSTVGFRTEIVDRLPCLANLDAATGVYSAPAAGDPLCTQPAFHTTAVGIVGWADASLGYQAAYDAGWRPQAVLTDGTVVDLQFVAVGELGYYISGAWFALPAGVSGDIAEVIHPDSDLVRGRTAAMILYGYVDESVLGGQSLRNTATVSPFWADDTEPTSPRQVSATLHVAEPLPQVGMVKSPPTTTVVAGQTVPTHLQVRLSSPEPLTVPLVVEDLLPPGFAWTQPPTVTWSWVSHQNATVTPETIQIPDYQGSGRTLVRFTFPAGAIPAGSGTLNLLGSQFAPVSPALAGTFINTAEVMLLGLGAEDILNCSVGSPGTHAGDPPQPFCSASMSIRVTADGPPSFQVTKTVQGDDDEYPRAFPHVGTVSTDGGTARYHLTWTNTGGTDLTDVVMYDILPHVDDVGPLTGTPRGSEFSPVLTGITTPLPAGVSVAYSTSLNPCRPEVAALATCDGDWSATVPAGGLAAVTALRLTSTQTYSSGGSFSVDFTMSLPARDDPADVAWNSAAARASIATATGPQPLEPAEGPMVGVRGPMPLVELTKYVNGVDADETPGLTVPHYDADTGEVPRLVWTYQVANTGEIALQDVTLADGGAGTAFPGFTPEPVLGDDGHNVGDLNGDGLLDPGEVWLYTTPEAAVGNPVAGEFVNTATVTATPVLPGLDDVGDTDSAHWTTPAAAPGIDIAKEVFDPDTDTWADSVDVAYRDGATWRITVTNTGNVPLTGVTVTDELVPGCAADPATRPALALLAPGASESWTCTLDPVVTGLVNVATVSGTPPEGDSVNDQDSAEVTTTPPAVGIELTKYVNGHDEAVAPGLAVAQDSEIIWTFAVSSTGSVPLSNVMITDAGAGVGFPAFIPVPMLGDDGHNVGDTNGDGLLDPGETWWYTTAESDRGSAALGEFTNTAEVSALPVYDDLGEVRDTAEAHWHTLPVPAVTMSKLVESAPGSGVWIEADGSDGLVGRYPAGSTVAWRIVVTNTGQTELVGLAVTDSTATACERDLPPLAVGASVTIDCSTVERSSRVNIAAVGNGEVFATDTAEIVVTPVSFPQVVPPVTNPSPDPAPQPDPALQPDSGTQPDPDLPGDPGREPAPVPPPAHLAMTGFTAWRELSVALVLMPLGLAMAVLSWRRRD